MTVGSGNHRRCESGGVDWLGHQDFAGNVAGTTASEEAYTEGCGGVQDSSFLGSIAFDNPLADEQRVGTFFRGVGDCTELPGATLDGVTTAV